LAGLLYEHFLVGKILLDELVIFVLGAHVLFYVVVIDILPSGNDGRVGLLFDSFIAGLALPLLLVHSLHGVERPCSLR
jgi:hypothetical protein